MARDRFMGQVCFGCRRTSRPPNKGWYEFTFYPLGESTQELRNQTASAALCGECCKLLDDFLTQVRGDN